ncbi:hypothetical protein AXK11_08725 [Cephaloticoccus primus]|uniref:Uncharacterized protein n=1 Tax=Cephaloticoccus primus TaxID=1548207 RepID=A0A139SHU5_9BACT|nr:hypothetical protein [Cephaloticoccus primus]KXU34119.1 hypothetical protein AXK11_08725 [Cephaloticoccus primus]
MSSSYFTLTLIIAAIVLMQVNQRLGSPVLAIFARWLRWFVFAFGVAQLCTDFELIDRPFWVLVLAFLMLWFLIETFYNWLGIAAMSVSPMPLFPRYSVNPGGEEWPTQARFLKLKEWLRAQGFSLMQPYRAEIGGGIFLRGVVYQNQAEDIRLQITFMPISAATLGVCYSLVSQTEAGHRIVTDNFCIPYAGFYPEEWFVERLPWCRSLENLLARHQARLINEKALPIKSDPLADLNAQQHQLDQLNTQLGFLNPHAEREELGKISQAGRYRVWKEVWMLNYLGRPARYR